MLFAFYSVVIISLFSSIFGLGGGGLIILNQDDLSMTQTINYAQMAGPSREDEQVTLLGEEGLRAGGQALKLGYGIYIFQHSVCSCYSNHFPM